MTKTRFAPSPTGKLHVGNVRTALFAYLYARHTEGHFVIRIEDTDKERSKDEYTTMLLKDLQWLGIDWNEGPQIDGTEIGEKGPYHQSKRLDIYKRYADKLIDEGRAYYCYCTPEETEERKQKLIAEGKPPHYDGHCRNLSAEQIEAYKAEGREPIVRFWAYDQDFTFKDIVRGEVKFPTGMVGDFVILRSTGIPVYNFAVVVDDALMEITHVLRAEEHLSNTVRQLMIYRALDFKPPKFAHMALVLGEDKQKLSKRHGAASVEEFRELGYLPESILNYLAMLGWSSPDGSEIFDKDKLIKMFELKRLSKHSSIFDVKKLDWIAKHHIINQGINRIFDEALPFIKQTGLVDDTYLQDPKNIGFLKGVVELTRGYCSHLSQIKEHIGYFLNDDYEISDAAMKFLQNDTAKTVLEQFRDAMKNETRDVSEEVFAKIVTKIMKDTNIKGKNLFMPLRAALTGKTSGPEIYFLIPVIGNTRTVERLDRVLAII